MASQSIPSISLPDEVKAVIWRIFGSGESPKSKCSTYELIEPIVKARVSPLNTNRAIDEIRGWFESHGNQQWLRSEMSEPVAVLILEEIKTERGETAIWAASSIAPERALGIIRSWSPKEIDSFVEAALSALKKLCDQDHVLDASRCIGLGDQDSIKANIPKCALERKGRLETFRHLEIHDFELLQWGLYSAAGNLIEFLIELQL